jgi:hypothetical protein
MSKYALFLDDERQPKDVKWIELPPLHWVVVKNYKEFVKTITEKGIPTTVSFDHDIHSSHYAEYIAAHDKNSPSFGTIRYELLEEKTGYECAKFLSELCVEKNVPIPEYFVHTLNHIGRQNIVSILESARKVLTKA